MKNLFWSLNIVSGRRLILEYIRRKLWVLFFLPQQKNLGSFFLDAQDHIGSERIITGNIYEAKTLIVLEKVIARLNLGSGIAFDVGANIGNHSCWFAKYFQGVHSFEPGTVASLLLRANIICSGLHNVAVHQCALGSRKSGGLLNRVSITNLGSSTVTESSEASDLMIYRGDDYWSELNIGDKVELIKIDVEGFELEVVKGLKKLLVDQSPLLCIEVLEPNIWIDLKNVLVDAGYTSWLSVTHGRARRGLYTKILELIRGRRYCLAPIPEIFPTGGYDMIFCLTPHHEKKFYGD